MKIIIILYIAFIYSKNCNIKLEKKFIFFTNKNINSVEKIIPKGCNPHLINFFLNNNSVKKDYIEKIFPNIISLSHSEILLIDLTKMLSNEGRKIIFHKNDFIFHTNTFPDINNKKYDDIIIIKNNNKKIFLNFKKFFSKKIIVSRKKLFRGSTLNKSDLIIKNIFSKKNHIYLDFIDKHNFYQLTTDIEKGQILKKSDIRKRNLCKNKNVINAKYFYKNLQINYDIPYSRSCTINEEINVFYQNKKFKVRIINENEGLIII